MSARRFDCCRSRWRQPARGLVAAIVFAVMLPAAAAQAALPSNCSVASGTVACAFASTGGEQTFTVPAGVSSVHVVAVGAAGARSIFSLAAGGRGAVVQGNLSVTPGQTLYVEVGGKPVVDSARCFRFGSGQPCIGGFNGGGSSSSIFGTGGGGASDVRTVSNTGADSLASRLLVAAGGGGAGDDSGGCAAGAGGDAGAGGADGASCGIAGGTGGGAGTSIAGGAGGAVGGRMGDLGVGGSANTGGAGGGGLYGGGGGGSNSFDDTGASAGGGGGGGGSNLVPPGGSASIDATGVPSVTISYPSAPTVSITAPADGASYAPGQRVTSSFTCVNVAGGPTISSCTDQSGSASGSPVDTSALGLHTFTVTATDSDGLSAQASVTYMVQKADTTTAVTSSHNPSVPGQSVTFTATVSGVSPGLGTPTGTVALLDGGTQIGTGILSGGRVSFTTTALGVGGHTVTARYGGDLSFNGSTGALTGNPQVVAAPPSVQIGSPVGGGVYRRGRVVRAAYRCGEGAGGPGLAACTGTVASGAPIDTGRAGRHTFTVTAISSDGQRTAKTVSYRVVFPSNRFTVSRIRTFADGRIRFNVKLPGPGRIDVLETAWNDNLAHVAILLQPAPRRFVYARKHTLVRRAGTVTITVRPNARGRRLVRHPRYRVTLRLWVSYTPRWGRPRSTGFYGLHLPG